MVLQLQQNYIVQLHLTNKTFFLISTNRINKLIAKNINNSMASRKFLRTTITNTELAKNLKKS